MSEQTCQHAFGKSTEASWRWCRLCGLPEAVMLLEAAEAEVARWKANDAASTEVIATTTIAWNEALAKLAAAERREAEKDRLIAELEASCAFKQRSIDGMDALYRAEQAAQASPSTPSGESTPVADFDSEATSTPSPAPSAEANLRAMVKENHKLLDELHASRQPLPRPERSEADQLRADIRVVAANHFPNPCAKAILAIVDPERSEAGAQPEAGETLCKCGVARSVHDEQGCTWGFKADERPASEPKER